MSLIIKLKTFYLSKLRKNVLAQKIKFKEDLKLCVQVFLVNFNKFKVASFLREDDLESIAHVVEKRLISQIKHRNKNMKRFSLTKIKN